MSHHPASPPVPRSSQLGYVLIDDSTHRKGGVGPIKNIFFAFQYISAFVVAIFVKPARGWVKQDPHFKTRRLMRSIRDDSTKDSGSERITRSMVHSLLLLSVGRELAKRKQTSKRWAAPQKSGRAKDLFADPCRCRCRRLSNQPTMSTEFIPPPLWDQFRGTLSLSHGGTGPNGGVRRCLSSCASTPVAFRAVKKDDRRRAHLLSDGATGRSGARVSLTCPCPSVSLTKSFSPFPLLASQPPTWTRK
jgi:hypothetical protein